MFYEIKNTTRKGKVSNRQMVVPDGFFGTSSDKILIIDNFIYPEEIEKILSIVDDDEVWNYESTNETWKNRVAEGNKISEMYPDVLHTVADVQYRLMDEVIKFYNVEVNRPSQSVARWFPGNSQGPHADNTHFPNYNIGSVIYLNNDYEGGELYLPQHDISFKPSAGQVVVFPGDLHYLHGVREITSGMRYTIPTFWKVLLDD